MKSAQESKVRSQGAANLEHLRNHAVAFVLPCEVGEVASARFWPMTEGSMFEGDPSVSNIGTADVRSTSPINRRGLKIKNTVSHALFLHFENAVLDGVPVISSLEKTGVRA